MIAKAKSISHGINDIRYITGETENKEHPERIFHVKNNLLQPGLDTTGIWESMKLTAAKSPRVRNTVIRIELNPAPEHTKDFSIADRRELWDDFINEFDGIELLDKNGRTYSPKTNLKGSKGTVWLHQESESGIPHLHGAYCRIDEDGRVNNDHDIHLRAQRAAERVALKRGWTTARQVRETNIGQVNRDCMEVLQSMDNWSWNEYAARLRNKGYEILELRDSKKVLHGYALVKGNASYKASKLGKGRNLTASWIEATWKKLHQTIQVPQNTSTVKSGTPAMPKPSAKRYGYVSYKPCTVFYDFNVQGKDFRFYIPEEAAEVFNDEFDYRETSNHKELMDMAVALFVGLMDTPVISSSGGGGSNDESPWGRKEDEDDREWARRCARMAARCMGRKPKSGYRR